MTTAILMVLAFGVGIGVGAAATRRLAARSTPDPMWAPRAEVVRRNETRELRIPDTGKPPGDKRQAGRPPETDDPGRTRADSGDPGPTRTEPEPERSQHDAGSRSHHGDTVELAVSMRVGVGEAVSPYDVVPTDVLPLPDAASATVVLTGPTVHLERTDVAPAEHLAWLRGADGDFLLSRSVNVIGSDDDADIVVDGIRPLHATIRADGERWSLSALAPTRVNGNLARDRVDLNDGDTIDLGAGATLVLFIPRRPAPTDLILAVGGATAVGGRKKNEDAFHCDPGLIAVADGVGGRPSGALASRLAIESLVGAGPNHNLDEAVRRANHAVRTRGEADPLATGMATTLDAAVLLRTSAAEQWLHGVHIGDGIALLQRDVEVTSLTQAHTVAAQLVASGRLTVAEGQAHPDSGTLLRAVGMADTITPDTWRRRAEPGHRYLLASDGLLAALGDRRLHKELAALRASDPETCANTLVDRSVRAGAPDNVTVVIADVVPRATRRADRDTKALP